MVYKRIGLYDAEKADKTGNGYCAKYLRKDRFTADEIAKEVVKAKEEQKKKNEEYRKTQPRERKDNKLIKPPIRTEPLPIVKKEHPVLNDLTLHLDAETGNTIFVLGSSKMGKSTVLMYIYQKYYADPNFICTLFTINYHIKLYIKDKYLLICKAFDDNAEKVIKIEKYINSKTKNKYNFINFFDDILDVRYNRLMNEMIMTYRNSNLSSIISLQYTHLLGKSARSNVNNVICFGFNTDESILVVIKTYLKSAFAKMGYKTEEEQVQFYKDMTKDHGFIYIHPASQSISFHRLKI
jgi:hypothetical protein